VTGISKKILKETCLLTLIYFNTSCRGFKDLAKNTSGDLDKKKPQPKFKSNAIFEKIEEKLKSEGQTLVNKVKGVFAFKVKVMFYL
jgi:hypothetical protein